MSHAVAIYTEGYIELFSTNAPKGGVYGEISRRTNTKVNNNGICNYLAWFDEK